ncbi:DUF6630 family protein [Naasia aerilata]|uniref:DUF6630 family protein n=1 Tax=Naasia aerilata TaxID=1162966 RepID=UPI00257469A3|nr:hypothetical protein [Naasia aerilata]
MADSVEWERLTRLLDDDEHLWPRVLEAFEDDGEDAWEALLGGLDDAGVLAYLHEDDSGMELADALAQLPRVFRLSLDLGRVNDTDDLDEAMAAADTLLSNAGFRLVMLEDDDEDARALVVVPAGVLDEITELATAVGHSVNSFD